MQKISIPKNSRLVSPTFGKKLGLVGGGQLARMLVIDAHSLGLESHVLCHHKDEPATRVTPFFSLDGMASDKSIKNFVKDLDYLTFESELVPTAILRWLDQNDLGSGRARPFVFPRPSLMLQIQNRASQKKLLEKFQIPTLPWLEIDKFEKLYEAAAIKDLPLILKKSFGGYDGYGTYLVDSKKMENLKSLFPGSFILEPRISFERELALGIVRNTKGQFAQLPLVHTVQKDSKCDFAAGPIDFPVSGMVSKIKKMMNAVDYVGILHFEFFLWQKKLWVNELAPRVHNSSHFSMDALSESQFTLHLKAGLGHRLTNPRQKAPHFAMFNLIAQDHTPLKNPAQLAGRLHWYGKSESRPGRKMGHINYFGDSMASLIQLGKTDRRRFF